jgi:hypothetical protein
MLVKCPHCAKPHEVEAEKIVIRPTDEELIEFDIFRDNYKGKKRGLITEMDNFTKKHKDWKEVLLILNRLYLDWGEQKYIPHFQTFINQRQWEMFDIKPKKISNPYGEEFNWRKK